MKKRSIFRGIQFALAILTCVLALLVILDVLENAWWLPFPAVLSLLFGGLAGRAGKQDPPSQ